MKLLLVVVVSFIFTILLPGHKVNFHNVDEFDAVWPYKDLVLDEDLFIKKTNDQIKEEQDKASNNASLVFNLNTDEKEEKLQELLKSDAKLYSQLAPFLDSIYKIGVVQANEAAVGKTILLQENGVGKFIPYNDLYTISAASETLVRLAKENEAAIPSLVNLNDLLAITIYFDAPKTEAYKNSIAEAVSIYKAAYSKGDKLVEQGEQLTNEKRELISDFFRSKKADDEISYITFIGRWGLMFVLAITLLMYLFFFRKSIFGQNLQIAFLYLCLLTAFVANYLFYKYGLMLSALPFILTPIIVRAFFDSRTALFTHLISILCCSFFMADVMEFILMQLVTGIGILFSVSEMRKRQQILNAAIIAIVFYFLIFVFYHLGFGTKELTTKFSAYLPYLISGSLVLLATPLIFIIERLFGFISDFKLLELCDLNQPLLRDLSQKIPGTFQHSLQVANLAEEAIYFIGGNTLLVRAGAMYHDVGKIHNPSYFTENLGNNVSPHIEMQPKESARIIIDHVIEGIQLAKKYKLPEQIIDFIRTHHGTTTVGFFLNMHKKEQDKVNINEDDFRYPGPIPFSKETAVLMLADGVEAASRSLKKHDALTINDLVDQIIDYKINQNQLINADITFKDITLIKKIFKKTIDDHLPCTHRIPRINERI
ncbi:MAG: HDIG domain-containing protein [Sphingobacteriaceae bacterium]|nr:HDIG domain-containing protein [Sphingobacteriaceae bacterium]